jgi:ABC-2 type transport system permease protein
MTTATFEPTQTPTERTSTSSGGFSVRRTATLARWNLNLLLRNRLAAVYATVMPMVSLAFLFTGDRGDVSIGATAISGVLLIAGLFPVYYNVLSQFVNRRDELVLKRMRTGEVRDAEMLVGIALPGVLAALLVTALSVPIALAFGQDLPINPGLFAIGAVMTTAMFAALAYWTAAWTRSAEAAQLTSLPIIMLAVVGQMGVLFSGMSDAIQQVVALTPGHAITEIVRIGWFGLDGADATTSTMTLADTWGASAQPLLVLAAWTVIGIDLARRSMRWEPRS